MRIDMGIDVHIDIVWTCVQACVQTLPGVNVDSPGPGVAVASLEPDGVGALLPVVSVYLGHRRRRLPGTCHVCRHVRRHVCRHVSACFVRTSIGDVPFTCV